MQHPINPLTESGLTYLSDRLTDIRVAIEDLRLEPQRDQAPVMERAERILPLDLFNELRAYLGSIEQAHTAICDLLYGEGDDLRADGLVVDSEATAYVETGQDCVICDPESPDACSPQGIRRPAWLAHTMAAERIAAQLERGLITRAEFEAAMAAINTEYEHRQGGALALSPESAVG